MDIVTNKAFVIAVGIFATVIITSAVFIVLGYVLDIYKNIAQIDYASLMDVGEFDKYSVSTYNTATKNFSGDTLNGVEVYNMLNKYTSERNIKLEGINKNVFIKDGKYIDDALNAEYYCSVIHDEKGITTIYCKKK